MTALAVTNKIRLAVVFLQFDRQKYSLAMERLISLISGFKSIEYTIVVVDNANPGLWFHEVSDHLIHIGGDNSSWEFSAFDRGVEFLEATNRAADVYGFATDAFLAYGDSYLEMIDEATLRYCVELRACVGWVDSFMHDLSAFDYHYREWVRTSLFFISAEVLPQVGPLNTTFEPDRIFGPTAETPFLASAPLNYELREHVLAWLTKEETNVRLEEVWHSQLDLTGNSFDFFKAKVRAILREHLLSAKMQSRDVPCYDFRLVKKLLDCNIDVSAISEFEKKSWQWLAGKDVEVAKQPRYNLDVYEAPRIIVHGRPSVLKLIGWVATEPQVREVFVQFSDGTRVGGSCDIPRPDVISSFPEFNDELCGFELVAKLDRLAPGSYELEWFVPDTGISEGLGEIQVDPEVVFEAKRCFVPDSAYPGQSFPLALEGVLESSYSLERIDVLWDGKKTGIAAELLEGKPRANGILSTKVLLMGEILFAGNALQHRLELVFLIGDGSVYTWRSFHATTVEEVLPHTLAMKSIGKLNPKTGLVPIHLRGTVLANSAEDRMVFMWENRSICEDSLAVPVDSRAPLGCFEVQREVGGIPAGTWELSLGLKREGQPLEIFARWRDRVELLEPVIHVEFLEARLPRGRQSPYILGICGWVENHFLVDRLLLKVDHEVVVTLAIHRLREDVARHFGESLVKKQGFQADVVLDVAPGDHLLQLVAVQENGNGGIWGKPLVLEDPSSGRFLAKSSVLTELEMENDISFWSTIAVSGEILTEIGEVSASLYVNGDVVDRQTVGAAGEFALSHMPAASGSYAVRVLFQSKGRHLYDSGTVDASFVRVEIPQGIPEVLDRFMERFGIRRHLRLGRTEDLVHALVQREREALPELFRMLRKIGDLLTDEKSVKGRVPQVPVDAGDGPSLKVLFACWEVPSSRHGGGVWMSHLLRELHGRHDITLIHGYGPDEEGWVDDVRPYVSKVISVPRMHQPALYRGDSRIPGVYYDNYTPGLRAAIESEVFVGKYDIVDYEYTKMYPHMSKEKVAQVASILENNFLASLTELSRPSTKKLDVVERVGDLLKSFYFLTVSLPQSCKEIIAITEEDAEILSGFQNDACIYVNTIGVDAGLEVPKEVPAVYRRDRQTLVFLGNYRHPPNIEAALFFVEEVMPDLRERCADFEFLIIGSHPSDDLKELDRLDDVRVTGFVEDYRPYLFAGTAFVAPIFTGAGMRVKVLEAMACAIPVIGTGLSMNGIGGVAGEHYYRAEDTAGFVDAVETCLRHPKAAKRIGRQGRQLIIEKHGYARKAREREAIWRKAIENHAGDKEADVQPQLSLVRGSSVSSEQSGCN